MVKKVDKYEFPLHKLADGRIVAITSAHGFKFSDGTEYVPDKNLDKSFLDAINIERKTVRAVVAYPNIATRTIISLWSESEAILAVLSECDDIDIILVPFMVVDALRQKGGDSYRSKYPKVLAYNATPETQRAPTTEKVVDVNNWAW